MKFYSAILIFTIFFASKSVAQIELEINSTNGYVSNKMKEEALIATGVSSNSIDAAYQSYKNISIGAGLSSISYFKLPDRNYLSYYAALGYSAYLNEEENASFNFLSAANFRTANEENSYSDSKQFLGGVQIKYLSSETSLLDFGLNIRYKSYDYLTELRFIDNQLSSSFIKSFQTKTTFNLSAGLNAKIYSDKMDDIISTSGVKGSKGSLNQVSTQFNYQIAVAQNIFESTGLRLSFNQSIYLKDYVPPLEYVGFDFSGDGEFFDDPYSYEQKKISARLTQILPMDIKLITTYSYAEKAYNYMAFVSDEIFVDRDDKHVSYSVTFEKRFKFDDKYFSGISLRADYEFFKNNSTMPSMNYTGSYFLFGVELRL